MYAECAPLFLASSYMSRAFSIYTCFSYHGGHEGFAAAEHATSDTSLYSRKRRAHISRPEQYCHHFAGPVRIDRDPWSLFPCSEVPRCRERKSCHSRGGFHYDTSRLSWRKTCEDSLGVSQGSHKGPVAAVQFPFWKGRCNEACCQVMAGILY
ncbi:hypothetical protein BKA65DRAFT_19061 [Rhexocercosporidium sp. MPI-PUGE-AT-0058]|nr:hypothetical protein BKA65DRAFT_19061 [Rhexocercosporidium sp. MPI-PUGE-AT-0058]